MTREQLRAAFMAALRGVPAHHVTAALHTLTWDVNWNGCSKGHIADEWSAAHDPHGRNLHHPALSRVKLATLAARARARAAGLPDWRAHPLQPKEKQ